MVDDGDASMTILKSLVPAWNIPAPLINRWLEFEKLMFRTHSEPSLDEAEFIVNLIDRVYLYIQKFVPSDKDPLSDLPVELTDHVPRMKTEFFLSRTSSAKKELKMCKRSQVDHCYAKAMVDFATAQNLERLFDLARRTAPELDLCLKCGNKSTQIVVPDRNKSKPLYAIEISRPGRFMFEEICRFFIVLIRSHMILSEGDLNEPYNRVPKTDEWRVLFSRFQSDERGRGQLPEPLRGIFECVEFMALLEASTIGLTEACTLQKSTNPVVSMIGRRLGTLLACQSFTLLRAISGDE